MLQKISINLLFLFLVIIYLMPAVLTMRQRNSLKNANFTDAQTTITPTYETPVNKKSSGNATLEKLAEILNKVNGHMGTLVKDMKDLEKEISSESKRETCFDAALAGETLLVAVGGVGAYLYRRKKRNDTASYEPMVNEQETVNNPNAEPIQNNLLDV